MNSMKKLLNGAFIIAAILTMLEYYFICGMFTGPLMIAVILIIGIANLVYSAIQKNLNETLLYAIATIALCMGYWKIM
ncbi:MAG: hypothetical protein PHE02_06865 [Lachnospiraceae bacterium]|nr:hypothetical protein [Lachnospiraceae bacterium]